VRGRFVKNPAGKKSAKNVAMGFHDLRGVFHPIRASADYDPGRAGESGGTRRKKKAKAKRPVAKKKAAAKKKAVKRPAAKKKAAKRKGGRR